MLQENEKLPKEITSLKIPMLVAQEESITTLKQLYKDKTLVLYFYPKDMTQGCSIEARAFKEAFKKLEKQNVCVVGCSRDAIKSHAKFIEKEGLPFALLSDHEGKLTEGFGVWQEKKMYGKTYMGIVRSTFVIEKGKIIKAFPKVKPSTHVDEILEFLKERG